MELKSNPIGESTVWLASLIASPIRMCVADAAPGLIRFGRSLILVIPHTRHLFTVSVTHLGFIKQSIYTILNANISISPTRSLLLIYIMYLSLQLTELTDA